MISEVGFGVLVRAAGFGVSGLGLRLECGAFWFGFPQTPSAFLSCQGASAAATPR